MTTRGVVVAVAAASISSLLPNPYSGPHPSFQLLSCRKEAASSSVLIPTLVNNNDSVAQAYPRALLWSPSSQDQPIQPAMIMYNDTRKTNHTALIVSLVILVVSFVGVIVFLACCSECPRRPLFRRAQAPDEQGPETPLQPGTPPPSRPIAIPGAVATSRHRQAEREWPDAQASSGGATSTQSSDAETERSGPDSVPLEYLGVFPHRYLSAS